MTGPRIWLESNGKIDTFCGHCRAQGIAYRGLISKAHRRFEGIAGATDEQLSELIGIPVKRVSKPGNSKELINYKGKFRPKRTKKRRKADAVLEFLTMPLSQSPAACQGYY